MKYILDYILGNIFLGTFGVYFGERERDVKLPRGLLDYSAPRYILEVFGGIFWRVSIIDTPGEELKPTRNCEYW